jgi:hypothetical protein
MLQYWQHEGGGFAGSGLGQTNDITALHNWRDGFMLDRCGYNISKRPHTGHDARMKIEGFETHYNSLVKY